MWIRFIGENGLRLIEAKDIGTDERWSQDNEGNRKKYYVITENTMMKARDLLSLMVNDIVKGITGNREDKDFTLDYADTFIEDIDLQWYETEEQRNKVFEEIQQAIAEGKCLYVMPEGQEVKKR